MANSTTGIRLGEETQQRLENLAKLRGRSPHYLMKTAVERYVNIEEAVETERQLIKSRWEKFEITGETISHDDVLSWVNSLK